MTPWDPQIDLSRLLDALAREILAAGDDEVRRVNLATEGAIRGCAAEVRQVIDAVLSEGAARADVETSLPLAAFLREHRVRQH
jgi:hypothetical protein